MNWFFTFNYYLIQITLKYFVKNLIAYENIQNWSNKLFLDFIYYLLLFHLLLLLNNYGLIFLFLFFFLGLYFYLEKEMRNKKRITKNGKKDLKCTYLTTRVDLRACNSIG